ncbi:esterase ybfF [Vibrio maritimus]|uniref:Esterase ybfF n=1 Tax=Vibrio maritimus TaxID=990268 RepID=A0A090SZ08_9VIBR|nr:esterase ybfF [Vibrio maritimus]
MLARELKQDHDVISVDLRNHGRSFHSDDHDYALMASDIITLLKELKVEKPIIIGHSMGGKVAMRLCDFDYPLEKLVVMDMSPVKYTTRRHDNVLAGLNAVCQQAPKTRAEAMEVMSEHIEIDGVRQFLGKSLFNSGEHMGWRFNLEGLEKNYWNILDWQPINKTDTPVLFLKGADSDYLQADHQAKIQQQFAQVKVHIVANTGHWLHAEKPNEVLRAIRKFI